MMRIIPLTINDGLALAFVGIMKSPFLTMKFIHGLILIIILEGKRSKD